MFWGDKITDAAAQRCTDLVDGGTPLVIRDEKTASGPVHVGSMRGVAIHGIVSELLSERGIENEYLYEINDFDAFDSVPSGLAANFAEHLGKPLFAVPAPDGIAENYAEYFGGIFSKVIEESGFHPTFLRNAKAYRDGKYNDAITIALEHADKIRNIYARVSGSHKDATWLPLMVVCESCGKVSTTRAESFDGEFVTYTCDQNVEGVSGCGHRGCVSPFDGNAKLPWKVEWAAKFVVYGVHVEGNGKDLSTRGGARDVANHIVRDVFNCEPPYDIPYEFFLVGGKKMSASKGTGASAHDISALMPPHIFRLALIGKDPKQAFNFDPTGDTLPVLFDRYDTLAGKHFAGANDDDARLFLLVHKPEDRDRLEEAFLPRFSQVAFLVQMPHMNLEEEVAKLKGSALTEADIRVLEERSYYASNWLTTYAPEEFKYELQEILPEAAKGFSDTQKHALGKVYRYIDTHKELDGQELHTALHDIRKEEKLDPKEFFSALYFSFLGKESGPKAGWFLSVLDREFLLKRLREVIN